MNAFIAMKTSDILKGNCEYHGCLYNTRGICYNYTREHQNSLRKAFEMGYDNVTGRFERSIFLCENNSFNDNQCIACGAMLIDVDSCPNCGI